jgi:hypothetical protein
VTWFSRHFRVRRENPSLHSDPEFQLVHSAHSRSTSSLKALKCDENKNKWFLKPFQFDIMPFMLINPLTHWDGPKYFAKPRNFRFYRKNIYLNLKKMNYEFFKNVILVRQQFGLLVLLIKIIRKFSIIICKFEENLKKIKF